MVKNDLKTGMWVKTRSKLWMIVVIDNEPFMIYPGGWMPIKSFPEVCPNDSKWNILAVYKYNFNEVAGSLQYDVWKDHMEDKIAFTKIWLIEETIKIGEITYDKFEFEQAVKNLKPINK